MFFIKKRIIEEALYIQENHATLRQTALIFNISKTTVHKDMNERLIKIDKNLYFLVKEVLANNLKNRHIKGGEETKRKYKLMRA